jgi:hypothetical protein
MNEWLSAVSTTLVIKENNFKGIIFSYFVKSLVGCTLHFKIVFLLIFIFRCRQVDIVRPVLSPVSTTTAGLDRQYCHWNHHEKVHRYLRHPDQRPLRPPKLLQTKQQYVVLTA